MTGCRTPLPFAALGFVHSLQSNLRPALLQSGRTRGPPQSAIESTNSGRDAPTSESIGNGEPVKIAHPIPTIRAPSGCGQNVTASTREKTGTRWHDFTSVGLAN